MPRKPKTKTLNWTDREADQLCSVEVTVEPAQAEIRWGENAQPGFAAGIEDIISVTDEDGKDRPDLVEFIEKNKDEWARLEEELADVLRDEARDY